MARTARPGPRWPPAAASSLRRLSSLPPRLSHSFNGPQPFVERQFSLGVDRLPLPPDFPKPIAGAGIADGLIADFCKTMRNLADVSAILQPSHKLAILGFEGDLRQRDDVRVVEAIKDVGQFGGFRRDVAIDDGLPCLRLRRRRLRIEVAEIEHLQISR